ncbi:N-6 DNA methylase [bacterium]|nr:N-6 DNA methylase [bacterium]
MLDSETKRRIDSARDILVGKIPDPKSQVEQITIALIYKFMDDMDRQAESLPRGKAKFFTKEYKKYAWRNIFDPRNSGQEVVNLYGEALQNMNYNNNVPQLFRDIFKNAYLPYRDPETLKDFLKEINTFEYDHSERLGDAFEYLLSVLGSQGDAGQFRTPRNIIDFMVEILEPKKNERILDPACGTAGFLISAYKHIIKRNSKNYDPKHDPKPFELQDIKLSELTINGKGYKGEKLTSDDRKRLVDNIFGYDISPDMVRLSLVNMYLHGFSNPSIAEYDTLSRDEKWDEKADVILANPPFMSPKGGIKPHNRFSVQANRSEVLFVDYMAEHLNPQGRAAIIVPEGIIFQTSNAYKQLRKMLVEDHFLVGVISLPAGLFNPYSGVKTSILWFDKKLAKKTDKLLFVKIENDGFDLGAQRRPIKKNDLPEAYQAIMEYKEALLAGKVFNSDGWQNIHLVEKSKIAEGGEYNLSGERYKTRDEFRSSNYIFKKLGDVAEFKRGPFGGSLKKDIFVSSGYCIYEQSHAIQNDFNAVRYYIDEKKYQEMTQFHLNPGDLIMSCSGTMGKVAIAPTWLKPGIINQALLKLSPSNKIDKNYLKYMMESDKFQCSLNNLTYGAAIKNVASVRVLKNIQLPLPPLPIQQEIVAELDGYQKIINGARQVVENYKPRIDIDPEWEMVELGKVCELNPKKSRISDKNQELVVSFVPMADINENQMYFESKQKKRLGDVFEGYTYFQNEDVLLAKVTPCFENGKAGLARNLLNGIGFGSSEFYVLRAGNKVRPEWIYYNIVPRSFRGSGKAKMTGTGGLQRVPKDFVSKWLIPRPDTEVQDKVIYTIQQEQQIVDANKKLIKMYEQKIKDRIAKVWGEK